MIDPITGEEIAEESGEKLTEEEQKAANEAKAAEEAQKAEDEKKEEARKAYELRQQKKAEKGVSREEFEELNKKISSIEDEKKDLQFRNNHPGITDEEFNSIKAHGPDYEKTLNDPVFEKYFKDKDIKTRVDRATAPPSTKIGQGNSNPDVANMSTSEFANHKNQVLMRRNG
jgi:hypothetical protein